MPRRVVAVHILLSFLPSLAYGQATKAGGVTILEGTATARRVALPESVNKNSFG